MADSVRSISIPKIDATDPAALAKEIFDDDRWVKDEFSKIISAEVLKFAGSLAAAFKLFGQLDKLAEGDEQAAFVAGFVHGIFDDMLVSTKLLVAGKLMASGNLMRQAIEGIAVASLCASRELVQIRDRKSNVRISYWERVKKDDSKVRSYKALEHLEVNATSLGLSIDSVRRLAKARSRLHQFSHPGLMGIASRMALGEPGPIFLGGSFDTAKIPAYKKEIEDRIGLCGILPNVIKGLVASLNKSRN